MNKLSRSSETATPHETMLAVLNALDGGAHTNQRSVASRAGVALGLANALIKRCVRKGLVKISQAPARRYAYYLTPDGFAEKSRLVAEYLSVSLDFFRQARAAYGDLFALCEERGWRRIVLAGDGELAEIAQLAAQGRSVELIVVDDASMHGSNRWPVLPNLEAAGAVDAVIITDTKHPQARFEALTARLGTERVLAPEFLQITPPRGSNAANAAP
ncbi:MAG TPA: winged helix-turn-helix transcriptional regulator [Stellaceae bacterium]|nr:winged helix-turn-helix transcriptional regulator [Stellaceae bacterium]